MKGKNKVYLRAIQQAFVRLLQKGHSVFLIGPRQVGKTTLVQTLLREKSNTLHFPLQDPEVRIRLERDPSLLLRQLHARPFPDYVFVDEAQKVPALLDAIQHAIDEKLTSFLITGSSARKLKRKGVNLLPGRVRLLRLDPFSWDELGWVRRHSLETLKVQLTSQAIPYSFHQGLVFGTLPGVIQLPGDNDRREFLKAYATLYLEEEIRDEALTRKIGSFSTFLELAARESGTAPHLTKLSMESGVSIPAIKEFFHVLSDTLIVETVTPYLKSARKRILASPRYYFFDLGVRNALARLPLTQELVHAQKGVLFEHAVILELIRRIRILNLPYTVHYWRTQGGAEVDCVIDTGKRAIPIEIKASEYVSLGEIKGLVEFLKDYKQIAKQGYIVTLGKAPEKLSRNITVLPWHWI